MNSFLFFFLVLLGNISTILSHEGHEHEPEVHGNIDHGIWKGSRNISMKMMTGVDLRWISTDDEWVTMEMKAKTTGYVAVGFCPNWHGTMEGCDIVIGWVAHNGTGFIRDYFATSNDVPEEDESQDYILTHAVQDEFETRIQFRRKWETEDARDADLRRTAVRVIYAWHPQDPTNFLNIPPHDRSTRGHTLKSESFQHQSHSDGKRNLSANFMFLLVLIFALLNRI